MDIVEATVGHDQHQVSGNGITLNEFDDSFGLGKIMGFFTAGFQIGYEFFR